MHLTRARGGFNNHRIWKFTRHQHDMSKKIGFEPKLVGLVLSWDNQTVHPIRNNYEFKIKSLNIFSQHLSPLNLAEFNHKKPGFFSPTTTTKQKMWQAVELSKRNSYTSKELTKRSPNNYQGTRKHIPTGKGKFPENHRLDSNVPGYGMGDGMGFPVGNNILKESIIFRPISSAQLACLWHR